MRVSGHRMFFYLLLIFLPTQLGLHGWPDWAFVLGRRVDYLSPTLYFTDILIALLTICWCIDAFPKIKKISPRVKYLVCMSSIYIAVNIWFAASRPVAMYAWVKILEMICLGWYVVATKPRVREIIPWLSIGIVYSSLVAITQFMTQRSVGGIMWFLGERTFYAGTPGIALIPFCIHGMLNCPLLLRPYATFPHPNVLGGYLAVLLPVIIYNSVTQQTKKTNWFLRLWYGLSIIVGTVAIAITFSRSAWIAGALGVALIFKQAKMKTLFVISGIAILILIVIIFVDLRATSESIVIRDQLTTSALTLWKKSPWVGIGLGNFLVTLPYALPARTIYYLQPVHNIYLLLLAETGIAGIIILSGLLVTIRKQRELKTAGKHVTAYAGMLQVIRNSLFIFLALGILDHYPITLQQGRLTLALLIGLSLLQ